MSNELKPCPFCGSQYTQVRYMGLKHYPSAFENGYRGECCDCGAITRALETETGAANAWNTRADVEQGAVSMTEENMAEHGWVRERTCGLICHEVELPDGLKEKGVEMCVYECGECGERMFSDYNYCPNCGAKVVE